MSVLSCRQVLGHLTDQIGTDGTVKVLRVLTEALPIVYILATRLFNPMVHIERYLRSLQSRNTSLQVQRQQCLRRDAIQAVVLFLEL
jgi:hypothetical protein